MSVSSPRPYLTRGSDTFIGARRAYEPGPPLILASVSRSESERTGRATRDGAGAD